MNPNNSKKIVTIYVSNTKNRKTIIFNLSIPNDFFPILPEGKKNSVWSLKIIVFKNISPALDSKFPIIKNIQKKELF